MILLVKNAAEYDQSITMHTGEEKVVIANSAIRVNTGTDNRLMSFYLSLMSSNFEVSYLQGSSQEINRFNDAKSKLESLRDKVASAEVFQDNKEYPTPIPKGTSPELVGDTVNPLTLDKKQVNNPVPKVPRTDKELPNHVTVIDSKLGEPIPDLSPEIPEDYPENPAAVAELARLEAEENKQKADAQESDNKWYALNECTEDELKKLLLDEFGENTRLKNKSKIIYHIMELADDDGKDVYELADKYKTN